jgi:hypothetical protein
MAADDENHFEYALGFAVVRRWADLSRETQQLGNGHGEGFRREVDRDRPYSSGRHRQRAALTMVPTASTRYVRTEPARSLSSSFRPGGGRHQ